MFGRTSIFLTVLLLAGIPVAGHAQNVAGEESPDSRDALVRTLIQKLASSQFADRQKATEEILSLDAEAVPLLQTELTNATGETATRLRAILPRLQKHLFDEPLEDFIKNPSPETSKRLPGWQQFSEIAGDGSEALNDFAEILRAERTLFAMRMFSAKDLSAALETRSAEFAKLCHGRASQEFPIASCMALMLLGSDPETRLIRATSTNISKAFSDPRFSKLVRSGVHSSTLKAITGAWINRPGIAPDNPLLFALKHELPSGRSLAHRIIQSGTANQSMYYALLCLAKLNSPEDLPIVESVIGSTNKLWPPRDKAVQNLAPGSGFSSSFSVQTGDVALAVSIHLRGRNPRDFGMMVIPSDLTFFYVPSMGFENNAAREIVFARFRSEFPAAE